MKHLIGGALAVLALAMAFAFAPKQQTAAVALQVVPRGAIVMWTGSLSDVPRGWLLCDGTRGTPDLRDRFVMGAPAGSEPGRVGGAEVHDHDLRLYAESPRSTGPALGLGPSYSPSQPVQVAHFAHGHSIPTHTHPFQYSTVPHLPPYYEVAFIMKR